MKRLLVTCLFFSVAGCPCLVSDGQFIGAPCSADAPVGTIVLMPGRCAQYYRTCDLSQPGGACTEACSTVGDLEACRTGHYLGGICAEVSGARQCAFPCELDGGCWLDHKCPEADAGCPTTCCRAGYACVPVPHIDGGAPVLGACMPGP